MNLEITTHIGCAVNCSYCPQDKIKKAYSGKDSVLAMGQFIKLMDHVPTSVGIVFAGYSEAFLNKDSSSMMRYVIERGYMVTLYTTTIGMSEHDIEVLKGLRFRTVSFHKRPIKYFERNKELFKKHIHADIWSQEVITNPLSRAGNLEHIPEEGKGLFCSVSDFDHNVVVPNGDLYLCCMDYGLTEPMGNLFDTPYLEIERGGQYDLCKKCSISCLSK